MSSILPTGLTGTSPIDTSPIDTSSIGAAQMPADVRKAGPKAEQLYETAVGFEQVLLQQLTQELQATTGGDGSSLDGSDGSDDSDDSSDDSSDPSTSLMTQLLPDTLAQGLTGSGGIGIARELYDSMRAQAGIPASGATSTGATS
jgi:Rod binding domain-containing protein